MTHPLIFFHIPGIPDYVTMAVFVVLLLSFLSRMTLKRRISLVPGGLQNVMEIAISAIDGLVSETVGPKGRPYFPLIATLGFFIFISNVLGLVPGFLPPTANLNTTAACAITVFLVTHIAGIKEHGFGYIKHFMGSVWWLAPLMFPIEVIGHFARPLSLSLRLFGNMTGHELVVLILMFLAPAVLPSAMSFLGLLVAFIQTFVFVLLASLYLSGALEEAH